MAFPATKLPLVSEMLIDGEWIDATADRLIDDGRKLVITRGRQDWASRAVASECEAAYLNPTGKYSNRNPLSPYFQQLGRETEHRHRIQLDSASFTGNVANSWGTSDGGLSFNLFGAGGAVQASDWQRTGGVATMSVPVAAGYRSANLVGASWTNVEARITFRQSFADIFTDAIEPAAIMLRGTSSTSFYLVRVSVTAAEVMRLQIYTPASVLLWDDVIPGVTWAASTNFTLSAAIQGHSIRAKVWRTDQREPSSWQVTRWDPDTAIAPGWVGVRAGVSAGNTNSKPILFTFDNLVVNRFRFWGKGMASAPAWDLSGKKVLAPFKAAGILQELSAGNPPAWSAMRRTSLAASGLVAYYPLEDATGATQFASAFADPQPPAVGSNFYGGGETVTAGGDSSLAGSEAVVGIPSGGNSLDVPIVDYTETGSLAVVLSGHIPSANANGFFVEVKHANGGTTTISIEAALDIISVDGSDGGTSLYFDSELTSVDDLVGRWIQVELLGVQSTGAWTIRFRNELGTVLRTMTGTSIPMYGKVTAVRITSFADAVTDTTAIGCGHVRVFNTSSVDFALLATSMSGHASETAGNQMIRVCGEAGIAFWVTGDPDDTALVGPQPTATIPEILFRAAEADQGILYEPRDAYALTYRPQTTLYDQVGTELDYTGGVIAPPFLPTDDDQILLNDVTAKRDGGSAARIVAEDGPLGTEAIGIRPEELAWNVFADDQLPGIAGWRVRQGTWDEARYPALTVNMAAPDVAGDTVLTDAVAGKDLGDRVDVINLPAWLPPDDVSLMIEGSTETFGNGKEWAITWLCVPAGPWRVYEYAADASDTGVDVGRYGADVFQLTASVTSSATSWTVTSDTPLSTDAAEYTPPLRLMCGGEEVWCTAVTGATSPQTLTVQRSKNGVVTAHDPSDPRHVDITVIENAIYVP